MLRAVAVNEDGNNVLLLGLSSINIQLIKAGAPILIELEELGLKGKVVIFHGHTEQDIMRLVSDLIGPDTVLNIDPRLVS